MVDDGEAGGALEMMKNEEFGGGRRGVLKSFRGGSGWGLIAQCCRGGCGCGCGWWVGG